MRASDVFRGLVLSLAAGAAIACPHHHDGDGDRRGQGSAYAPSSAPEGYDGPIDAWDHAEGPADDEADMGSFYDGDEAPGVWREDDGRLYMHGYRSAACACEESGLAIPASFFAGTGGVGPIPDGGYYGERAYVFVGGGSSARAFASASAHASARVSVRYRGGGHGKAR